MLLQEEDIRKISLEKRKKVHASYVPVEAKKVENVQKPVEKVVESVKEEVKTVEENTKNGSGLFKKNIKEEVKTNKKK